MAVDDKKIYVPLTTIYGTKQNDGSYNLSALDVKNINDNLWNIVNKFARRDNAFGHNKPDR